MEQRLGMGVCIPAVFSETGGPGGPGGPGDREVPKVPTVSPVSLVSPVPVQVSLFLLLSAPNRQLQIV